MINWKDKFDQIICVHYLPCEDRVERTTQELERVGILDSGIFRWDNSFDSPFYKILWDGISYFPGCAYGKYWDRYGQFKCSYQHYEIIKRSYSQKFKRILILEDDIVFMKDIDKLSKIIEDIPDCNVILLDKFCPFKKQYEMWMERETSLNDSFKRFDGSIIFYSSACYSLDIMGMEKFIGSYEYQFGPSDNVWNQNNDFINQLTKCAAIVNAGRQKNFSVHNDMGFNEIQQYGNIGLDFDKY